MFAQGQFGTHREEKQRLGPAQSWNDGKNARAAEGALHEMPDFDGSANWRASAVSFVPSKKR